MLCLLTSSYDSQNWKSLFCMPTLMGKRWGDMQGVIFVFHFVALLHAAHMQPASLSNVKLFRAMLQLIPPMYRVLTRPASHPASHPASQQCSSKWQLTFPKPKSRQSCLTATQPKTKLAWSCSRGKANEYTKLSPSLGLPDPQSHVCRVMHLPFPTWPGPQMTPG